MSAEDSVSNLCDICQAFFSREWENPDDFSLLEQFPYHSIVTLEACAASHECHLCILVFSQLTKSGERAMFSILDGPGEATAVPCGYGFELSFQWDQHKPVYIYGDILDGRLHHWSSNV
jgi:hypothetical protein